MNTHYCCECNAYVAVTLHTRTIERQHAAGESYAFSSHYACCVKCEDEVYDETLAKQDHDALEQLHRLAMQGKRCLIQGEIQHIDPETFKTTFLAWLTEQGAQFHGKIST